MKNLFTNKISTLVDKLKKLSTNFKTDKRGVAAIEMAFIFPIMVTLFIGMIDLSNGLSASRKVTITANTVGDLVTQELGSTTKAALDGIFTASLETMKPFSIDKVKLEIYSFRPDGDGNPELSWSHSKTLGTGSSSAPACGAAPTVTADMADLMLQGNDLIIARACYNFEYVLGKVFSMTSFLTGEANTHQTKFTMKEEMTLRPRRALQIDCDNCTQH